MSVPLLAALRTVPGSFRAFARRSELRTRAVTSTASICCRLGLPRWLAPPWRQMHNGVEPPVGAAFHRYRELSVGHIKSIMLPTPPANAKCADPASHGTDATEDWAVEGELEGSDAVAPLARGPARVLVDPVVPQTLCLMDPIGEMLPHDSDRLASHPSTERHLITEGAILERMRWWFLTDSSKPHNGANACDEASWKVFLSSTCSIVVLGA
ncbi:hypothetical protein B0H13DRAFT_2309887 [Mycena leptocephala]|nr:hypothetical protein B0H13DRAFT_2375317 [Mycena leptocephala]KAJ7831558.1 hypothetical protein B0H13DRAFT_2371395 [Mycena leptocephala]KAJ7901602.1 hypothetical protein B0H13DRAFT_2335879 [Mycena leptocephala]KAJ7930192.1 hypothetical protein B0H13DRAFT_2309887 [Mycena leptocephala]